MSRWPAVQHLSFRVHDVRRSSAFYRELLGFHELMTSDDIAELTMGETKLVLLRATEVLAIQEGMHFGFRVASRAEVDDWGRRAKAASWRVDFGPGTSDWGGYVLYFRDPDGYQIEIWTDA